MQYPKIRIKYVGSIITMLATAIALIGVSGIPGLKQFYNDSYYSYYMTPDKSMNELDKAFLANDLGEYDTILNSLEEVQSHSDVYNYGKLVAITHTIRRLEDPIYYFKKININSEVIHKATLLVAYHYMKDEDSEENLNNLSSYLKERYRSHYLIHYLNILISLSSSQKARLVQLSFNYKEFVSEYSRVYDFHKKQYVINNLGNQAFTIDKYELFGIQAIDFHYLLHLSAQFHQRYPERHNPYIKTLKNRYPNPEKVRIPLSLFTENVDNIIKLYKIITKPQ